MECRELSIYTTPWSVRDAWAAIAVWYLSAHLIVFSLAMSDLPMMLAVFIALQARAAGWQSLGFRKFDRTAVKLALKSMFIVYMVAGLNNALFRYFGWQSYPHELVRVLGGPRNLWIMFPYIVIVGPLAEEILFRGFFFAVLRQRYGWQLSAAISSAIFAMCHLKISELTPAFVLGYVLRTRMRKRAQSGPGS